MILNVFLHGKLVGRIASDEKSDITFTYVADASPISLSMKDTGIVYSKNQCIPFFEGLLPEGEIRRRMASIKHISSTSTLKMLSSFGREIAGALSIVPEGEEYSDDVGYYEVSQAELGRRIREKEISPLILCEEKTKLSLAGAENKIPVLFEDGRFFLPTGDGPTNYIIKASGEFCENEYMCTCLAKECGLPVSDVQLHGFDDSVALLIKRYDRIVDDGVLKRIHQEDFCQAFGIMPTDKYEEDGGPGFKRCIDLIFSASSRPIVDMRNFFKMAVFNYLIGNCDAHAKNFSFLYPRGLSSAELAPFYDIVSSVIYDKFDTNLAMKPKNQKSLARITRSDFYNLASPKLMDSIIDECVCSMKEAFDCPSFVCNEEEFEKIKRSSLSRIERIAK